MAFEIRQEVKLGQQLVMTPQLQQAIKLLQQSRLELVETVREEIESNPVLECTEAEEGSATREDERRGEAEGGGAEVDWQTYLEQTDNYSPGFTNFSDNTEESFYETLSAPGDGLTEHLTRQLGLMGLDESEEAIGAFIIGNIDNDGLLRLLDDATLDDEAFEAATLQEVAAHTGSDEEGAGRVLGVIQSFDPPGVGARTTRECLLLQARYLPVRDTLVEEVISKHLNELANKNYKLVASKLCVSVEEVIEAARTIVRELNPVPGSGYGEEESGAIIPDVTIRKVDGEYVVLQNDSGLPKLKISAYYRELLKGGADVPDATKDYIQEKFRAALWLIKSVQQRQKTIYRVVQSIARFQKDFLDKGVKHMRPLTLKDVADDIGVHESTVSRVTSNKYADTPRGVLKLKYFFSSSVSNDEGTEVAVEYIKNKIRELIAAEDAKKPLSDMKIVELLKSQEINLSRRTATKYREAMGVLSSHKRKRLI